MCVICAAAVTVIGVSAAFVETYVQFLALRFIIAFLCSGLMVIGFVLGELRTKDCNTKVHSGSRNSNSLSHSYLVLCIVLYCSKLTSWYEGMFSAIDMSSHTHPSTLSWLEEALSCYSEKLTQD